MSLLGTFNLQNLWKNLPCDIQHEIAQSIRRSIPGAYIWILRSPSKFLTTVPGWFQFTKFISPDGIKMIGLSFDWLFSLVEVSTGNTIFTAQWPEFLLDGEFSQDGQKIITVSSQTSTIRIFDITGRLLLSLSAKENNRFNHAHFSTDSLTFATIQIGGSVKLWNTQTGALIRTIVGNGTHAVATSFDDSSSRITTLSIDGTCHVWDCKSGVCLCTLIEVGKNIQLSPNGETVVSITNHDLSDGTNLVLEWDISWIKQLSLSEIGPRPLEQTLLVILLYACSKPDTPVSLYLIAKHNPQIDFEEIKSLWLSLENKIRQLLQSTYRVVVGGQQKKRNRNSE
jgi:hypothetical protein